MDFAVAGNISICTLTACPLPHPPREKLLQILTALATRAKHETQSSELHNLRAWDWQVTTLHCSHYNSAQLLCHQLQHLPDQVHAINWDFVPFHFTPKAQEQ